MPQLEILAWELLLDVRNRGILLLLTQARSEELAHLLQKNFSYLGRLALVEVR